MADLPPGWTSRDINDVVPEAARQDLIAFCQGIISERGKSRHDIVSIAQRAKTTLGKHSQAFEKNGVVLDFFAYWLEHQNNVGNIPKIIAALKR